MKVKPFVTNPVRENTYVVYDETGEAAIIDCGCITHEEKSALVDFVSENHLKVKYLLNTHLHFDHVMGTSWAAQTFGVQLFANKNDEYLLSKFDEHLRFFGLACKTKPQPLAGYLSENDVVNIGNFQLKVIETPGHTPGGICFYNENEHVLFSGDTLFCGSVGRTDLDGGDYGMLIKSLKKLAVLPDETVVFSGHGITTTIGDEKRGNPYL